MNFKEHFNTWHEPLKPFIESEQFKLIARRINTDREHYNVIPPKGSDLFFKVFNTTNYNKLRVVILGLDPYHTPGAYDGLAFSNSTLISPQPSLKNILKEVENDIYDGFNLERTSEYSLYSWAEQGVLLINTAMSVKEKLPESHLHLWRPFTEFWIKKLQEKNDIIWMLWGKKAESYKHLITNKSHYKLISGHPSPLNTYNPFLGCQCFSKCNEQLKARNLEEIIW